jgi:hypothetical protein
MGENQATVVGILILLDSAPDGAPREILLGR